MTYVRLGLMAGLVWLAIALGLALVMGRRGHDAFGWFLIGVVFGPLALILAAEAWRHGEGVAPRIVSRLWSLGPGPVDVLVGFDGSADSRAALSAAVDLLGGRVGRLTLATVVPYDGGAAGEREALAALEAAGAGCRPAPALEILRGRPAPALLERAVSERYGLLVIGTKGTGASRMILGSTATELARSAGIPVLMAGAGERTTVRGAVPAASVEPAPTG